MKNLTSLVLLAALFAVAGTASADINREVRRAQKLLAEGEYEMAFEEYQRVAKEKDNPLAKLSIALFYDNGWGRPADPVRACHWYEQAAQHDIPVAADALGRCLAEGIHQDIDYGGAATWYQKAADLGLHYSLCHLGALYIHGKGVDKDPARGLALCQQSAEQGSVPAMMRLADFYLDHQEIRDEEAAMHWLLMAASYNAAEAQYRLGAMLRDRSGTDLYPVDALEWFERAAGQGHVPAYFETAKLYFNAPANPETGLWYEEDLAKAYLWLSATLQAGTNDQRKQAEEMMTQIRKVMPQSWTADLDAKVEAHLKQFAAIDAPPE